MPRRSKGIRLWLEPAEHRAGKVVRFASWVIRDGSRKIRTGVSEKDREGADRALAEYIEGRYDVPRDRGRHPAEILVTDVLNIYLSDVAAKKARPKEITQRVLKLAEFFNADTLAKVNGKRCREYVTWRAGQAWKSSKPAQTGRPPRRVTESTARRELEDLRAAINHHRREGYCSEFIGVALPEKGAPREDWLTRSEAARLIRAARNARQVMRGQTTVRRVGDHIARFILVGLYTGTRHAAICGAALQPAIGRGYVDLGRGVFHRRANGVRETKKRQPPVRLSRRLLAHLRRWHRLGISTHAVVEWNGKPVESVRKGFDAAVRASGIGRHVTPHVLRHTAATWAMQAGADPWKVAGMLGMTVEMLERVYGHHHPDFQQDAVERLAGQFRDRNAVNKAAQTRANVTKTLANSKVVQ